MLPSLALGQRDMGKVDRFIPGQPEDIDEGAVAAGCAEAIDALLGAFEVDPPLIYAGAPFSDRGGSEVNHFEEFIALDPYEEQAWRLRVEGSAGSAELEFNGPVKGFQATYREGLAALDEAAGPARFADGAPEYGGNRDLIGWEYTNYDGLCSSFGCPINARGDALVSWLNPAVLTGRVRVIPRAFVHRIDTTGNGRRATAVRYVDARGRKRTVTAQTVVVAGSPINTARLLLMSQSAAHPNGLGNRSGQLGRNMMSRSRSFGRWWERSASSSRSTSSPGAPNPSRS